MKKLNTKGFSHVEGLIVAAVIIVVGAVGFYVFNKMQDRSSRAEVISIAQPTQNARGAENSIKKQDISAPGGSTATVWESKPENNKRGGAGKPTYVSEPVTLRTGTGYGFCAYVKNLTDNAVVKLSIYKQNNGELAQSYMMNNTLSNPAFIQPRHRNRYLGCGQFIKVTGPSASVRIEVQVIEGRVRVWNFASAYQVVDNESQRSATEKQVQEKSGIAPMNLQTDINVVKEQ